MCSIMSRENIVRLALVAHANETMEFYIFALVCLIVYMRHSDVKTVPNHFSLQQPNV